MILLCIAAGVVLSCQYDTLLDKRYPGFPIFYALSRQTYNLNIHSNTQALGRVWKKLREQADSFICVRGNRDCGDYFLIDTVCYDTYSSADAAVLPTWATARHGTVVARTFKIYKSELHYDTRHFRDVFLDVPKAYFEEVMKNVRG